MDRAEAARYGADVSLLGQAIQLLTHGVTVTDYRPADADGALEVGVRFPGDERSLAELGSLRVPLSAGLVPISNVVSFSPVERVGAVRRIDEERVTTIEANVAPGLRVNDRIAPRHSALDAADLPETAEYVFAGEAEDQQEAMTFLAGAFVAAIVLMLMVLVLVVTGRPFGIVMRGVGTIALAGIVVNNNIVLIDTFNDLRRLGTSPPEVAPRTGAQRLYPVVPTSVTTALGPMPMVIGLNIDFFTREIV